MGQQVNTKQNCIYVYRPYLARPLPSAVKNTTGGKAWMSVIGYSTVRIMFAAKLLLLLVIRLPQSRQQYMTIISSTCICMYTVLRGYQEDSCTGHLVDYNGIKPNINNCLLLNIVVLCSVKKKQCWIKTLDLHTQ